MPAQSSDDDFRTGLDAAYGAGLSSLGQLIGSFPGGVGQEAIDQYQKLGRIFGRERAGQSAARAIFDEEFPNVSTVVRNPDPGSTLGAINNLLLQGATMLIPGGKGEIGVEARAAEEIGAAIRPKNLLSIGSDAKTVKGQKYGYETGIMYAAPNTVATPETVCKFATPECIKLCLGTTSGRMPMPNVQASMRAKTVFWKEDPTGFLETLDKNISDLKRRAAKKGTIPVVRLNGTSDIPWEETGIMEKHPDTQFYDYTKYPPMLRKNLPPNYHLTYSYSGHKMSADWSKKWAERGVNTAVVFKVKKGDPLPPTFMDRKVIDGDLTDLRFLDDPNVIVGLRGKGAARKGESSFVQDVEHVQGKTAFIQDPEKEPGKGTFVFSGADPNEVQEVADKTKAESAPAPTPAPEGYQEGGEILPPQGGIVHEFTDHDQAMDWYLANHEAVDFGMHPEKSLAANPFYKRGTPSGYQEGGEVTGGGEDTSDFGQVILPSEEDPESSQVILPGQGGANQIPLDRSLSGGSGQNLNFALQGYRDAGASPVAAAALLGDADQESGFRPDLAGDRGTSWGLHQVGSMMYRQFRTAQEKVGIDPTSPNYVRNQAAFIANRFRHQNPERWAAMNEAPDAASALQIFRSTPGWGYGETGNRYHYSNQYQFFTQRLMGSAPPAETDQETKPIEEDDSDFGQIILPDQGAHAAPQAAQDIREAHEKGEVPTDKARKLLRQAGDPTPDQLQLESDITPGPSWAERAYGAIKQGDFTKALNILDTTVQQAIRRSADQPLTGPVTAETLQEAAAPRGGPGLFGEYAPREERTSEEIAKTAMIPPSLVHPIIQKAAYNLIVDTANFFNSPEGAALTVVTGGAEAVAPTMTRLVAMGFGADQARSAIKAGIEGRWSDAMEDLGLAIVIGTGVSEAQKAAYPLERPIPGVVKPSDIGKLEPITVLDRDTLTALSRQGRLRQVMTPDVIEKLAAQAQQRAAADRAAGAPRESQSIFTETAADKAMRRTGQPLRSAAEVAMQETRGGVYAKRPDQTPSEILAESRKPSQPQAKEQVQTGDPRDQTAVPAQVAPPQVGVKPVAPPALYYDKEGNLVQHDGHVVQVAPSVKASIDPGGVANRYLAEAVGRGELPPDILKRGTGQTREEALAEGRDWINKGGDPKLVADRVKNGGRASPKEFNGIHAEYDRLRQLVRQIDADAQSRPNDQALQKRLRLAEQARDDFLRNILPAPKTFASDMLKTFQGVHPVDAETFQGLQELMKEHNGITDITEGTRKALRKRANGAAKLAQKETAAKNAHNGAVDRAFPNTRTPSLDEMKAIVERMATDLTPCN